MITNILFTLLMGCTFWLGMQLITGQTSNEKALGCIMAVLSIVMIFITWSI